MSSKITKDFLEKIYKKYTKKEFIKTDPIIFPHRFVNDLDIEISCLISSSLAYGNIKSIMKTLDKIFSTIQNPYHYIKNTTTAKIKKDFSKIKHRFTTGKELSNFIIRIKKLYNESKSIKKLFLEHYIPNNPISQSYKTFLKKYFSGFPTLIPDPDKVSAMKRFNMFLRWVVRKDDIDFGIWSEIKKSDLIYPLDTHIHHFTLSYGITSRKDNSLKTALEVTNFFKKINPDDPVKYDFALSRIGILKKSDKW